MYVHVSLHICVLMCSVWGSKWVHGCVKMHMELHVWGGCALVPMADNHTATMFASLTEHMLASCTKED